MLLRREAHRRIAIPQPAHAGLSGQLAAAWGNAEFAAPLPVVAECCWTARSACARARCRSRQL